MSTSKVTDRRDENRGISFANLSARVPLETSRFLSSQCLFVASLSRPKNRFACNPSTYTACVRFSRLRIVCMQIVAPHKDFSSQSPHRIRTLTMVTSLLGMVVVVVVAVVSVVSLLSLLLLGLAPTRSAPSSKFFPRTNLLDAGHMSDALFALTLASFCATPVVHTLASLLPVLLSLPVLQCRHLRSAE